MIICAETVINIQKNTVLNSIILPLIATIVGGVISYIALRVTTNRQLSVQYKTDKRIEWIQTVRKLLAEYVTYAMDYYEYMSHKKTGDENVEQERSKYFFELNIRQAQLNLYFNNQKNLLTLLNIY